MEKSEKWSAKCAFSDGLSRCRNMFKPSLIDDLLCGVCGWNPRWLQCFRTMKVFLLCYITLGVFHGMYGSYIGSVIPSVERRFGFNSKETGIFRAMADVSRILSSLAVAHYGGAGHRPRWIGGGAMILASGMFLMAATELIVPHTTIFQAVVSSKEIFCSTNKSMGVSTAPVCTAAAKAESSLLAVVILGASEFIMGLGATTIVILALPFIDDNVTYRNSPLYFAMSMVGRLFGPLFGFGLAAICSSVFVNFTHPNFLQNDPRWISAWYLGLLVCAPGIFLLGFSITCFPSVVRNSSSTCKDVCEFDAKRRASVMRKQTMSKDFFPNLKRLLVNIPFMVKLASQLLEGLVISGYMSFLMKFIKEQYRVSQSTASLAAGIPGVFAAFVGIFIGSAIIKRWKLEPRHVQIMTAVAAVIGAASYFIVIGFGCEGLSVVGIHDVEDPYSIAGNTSMCFNKNSCNCVNTQFNPICDRNTGQSYASACVAGCHSARIVNKTKYYVNCSCLLNSTTDFASDEPYPSDTSVVPGLCQKACDKFAPYIAVMCIAKIFLGIPIAGVIMVQFRLVDYDLKSLANGLSSVFMSVFGFLPAPIIAGAIIDTTCRYWQKNSCGKNGSCLFYTAEDFRWKLHLMVGGVKLLTCAFDLVIAWLVWDMKFDRESSHPPQVPAPDETPPPEYDAIERKSPPKTPDAYSRARKKSVKIIDPRDTTASLETVAEENSDSNSGETADSAHNQSTGATDMSTEKSIVEMPEALKNQRFSMAENPSGEPISPPVYRKRSPSRRGSMSQALVHTLNTRKLAEGCEDVEFIPERAVQLRRGSLMEF